MTNPFKIRSAFKPSGDQPGAIKKLLSGINSGLLYQTLLGVTGSGKTFTMANVIESIQRPTLILAPNKTLAAVLLKHPHILVVSDDLYEHCYWAKEPFANMLMVCKELYDRCVIVNGVSKAYSMTGWRIGYLVGPANIVSAMKKIQSQSTSNPTSIAQVAAVAALTGDQSDIVVMNKAFKDRHDYIYGELKKMPGIEVLPSDGTFYTFPCVKKIIQQANMKNDIEFSEFLLNEAEIAVVPGSAFGAEGYVRISYATSMDNIKEALRRIHAALKSVHVE